ncbi:MAG: hypothetical protein N3E49_07150 [Bacteroidia bacterium]|nr:hypothetical protein [Bacteroidia bacterium]
MRALAVALLTAGMYLLVGCGGQQQEQKTEEQKTEQTAPQQQAPAEQPAQPEQPSTPENPQQQGEGQKK